MNLYYDDSKDLSEGEIIEIDGDSQNQVAIILPNFREKYGRLFVSATDLYEALKVASELLKIGIGAEDRPVPLVILKALAKAEN